MRTSHAPSSRWLGCLVICSAVLLAPDLQAKPGGAGAIKAKVHHRIGARLDLASGGAPLPDDGAVRIAMTQVLDQLQAEYGDSRQVTSMLKKKLAMTADSIIRVMGQGPTRDGKKVTVFSNRAQLEAHYDRVLKPHSVSLYDPRVIVGVDHISSAELAQIQAASQANPDNIQGVNSSTALNTSRYGYQLRMNLGAQDMRFPYSYGFVRFQTRDGRRVMRALVSIDKEPYAAAARHAPELLSLLETAMNVITHDNTMHNLWHQNGAAEPGDLATFHKRMNETKWSDLPAPNNEIDSAVGHYLVMQDVFATKPAVKRSLLAQARRFERMAERMRVKYRNEIYRAGLGGRDARKVPSAERRALMADAHRRADAIKSYYLTAYFNKTLTYVMPPEAHPAIKRIFDRNRFLYKNRKFAEQVVGRARAGKLAYPAASHAELLRDYRGDLRRFKLRREHKMPAARRLDSVRSRAPRARRAR